MTGNVARTGTYLTETGVESGTIRYTTADTIESLLDHLQEAGYEPADSSDEWYDLIVSGIGSVRVVVSEGVYVYAFDKHMVNEWQLHLSLGTPDAVICAVLQSAEDDLAAKRGGPVTPAQVAAQVRAVRAEEEI